MVIRKGDKFYFVLSKYNKKCKRFDPVYKSPYIFNDYFECNKAGQKEAKAKGLYYGIRKVN